MDGNKGNIVRTEDGKDGRTEKRKTRRKRGRRAGSGAVKKAAREIIEFLLEHPNFKKTGLTTLKNQVIKKYGLKYTIKNSVIIRYVKPEEADIVLPILRRRSTRSISGVTVVAVMTKPLPCPGNCIYCPGEKSQPGARAARSYTGMEPAARRSIRYNYDPYLQTKFRLLNQLTIGHRVDKVELIIMGGTFLAADEDYRRYFVKECLDAIKNFYEPNFNNDKKSATLEEAKEKVEKAKLRFVGLTIETRPDYCMPEHINDILDYGGTRVEIGVQTTRPEILNRLNRGHTVEQSIAAIGYSKDAGLKVNVHMMPNLPGSSPDGDLADFRNLFENPDFRPDMLKIYPTLVVKGTELYEMWKRGEYRPYPTEKIIEVLAEIKANIPPYVRIQRIQRDIPAYLIIDGVKKSNLRQLVHRKLEEMGKKCNCIRCRELGFINELERQKGKRKEIDLSSYELRRLDYRASGGKEIFLSFENDENLLIGYLRLRKPSEKVFRPELKEGNVMIVRELRVVGEVVPKDENPRPGQIQHRGFGKKLLAEAERIAAGEFGADKITVISGIGVREYFYKLGYYRDGVYVSKKLKG